VRETIVPKSIEQPAGEFGLSRNQKTAELAPNGRLTTLSRAAAEGLECGRLRRTRQVGENVAAYDLCARVVELVDTGDLSHLSAAGETRRM
jgi:hypothetical protein